MYIFLKKLCTLNVHAKVQNSCVLSLGLTRVQIDSIGSQVLSENRNVRGGINKKLKTTKIYQLRFWVWEITGRLSKEISSSDLLNVVQLFIRTTIIILHKVPTAQRHLMNIQGRRNTPKYLKKSCYHHIKCIVPTSMAAFMQSRPLNSVSQEITTQKKLKNQCDGINTQVMA